VIVPPGDADKLAAAIDRLIENPQHRKALGRAAKVRAQKRFSADQIVSRYETLYRSVSAEVIPCS
jgi:glycosyltransferase involved in cell wall biosynthesis